MRERAILFSGAMVRAILEGRKTVTRRLIKPQPQHGVGWYTADGVPCEIDWVLLDEDGEPTDSELRCPYGVPGDRLWVRESLFRREQDDFWRYAADNRAVALPADDPRVPAMVAWAHHQERDHCVSIHMPRWASRITLEVTAVRVERLQEITEEDAAAEGVELGRSGGHPAGDDTLSARERFRGLWDEINGKPGRRWSDNPWCWVVAFKRVEVANGS